MKIVNSKSIKMMMSSKNKTPMIKIFLNKIMNFFINMKMKFNNRFS